MPRRKRRSTLTKILSGLAAGGRQFFGGELRQLQRKDLLEQAGEQREDLREEDFRRQLALAGVQIPQDQPILLQDVTEQIRALKAAGVPGLEQLEAEAKARARGTSAGTFEGGRPPKTPEELEAEAFATSRGTAAGTLQGGPSIEDLLEREKARAAGRLQGGPDISRIGEEARARAAGTLAGGPAPQTPEEIETEAQARARGAAVGKAEGTPETTTTSQAQVQAEGRLGILENAEQVADRIEKGGAPIIRANFPDFLNFLRTSEGRQYRNAIRTIAITSLKTLFPGQLSDQEREAGISLVMPAPFDDEALVKQKADTRRALVNLVRLQARGQATPAGQKEQLLSQFKGAGPAAQTPDASIIEPAALQAFLDQGGDLLLLTNAQLKILAGEGR